MQQRCVRCSSGLVQRLVCEGRPMLDPLSLVDCKGISSSGLNLIQVQVRHYVAHTVKNRQTLQADMKFWCSLLTDELPYGALATQASVHAHCCISLYFTTMLCGRLAATNKCCMAICIPSLNMQSISAQLYTMSAYASIRSSVFPKLSALACETSGVSLLHMNPQRAQHTLYHKVAHTQCY